MDKSCEILLKTTLLSGVKVEPASPKQFRKSLHEPDANSQRFVSLTFLVGMVS